MKYLFLIVCMTFVITGCVNKPTQQTTVVDDRPRVSFESALPAPVSQYQLVIDGIDYGSLQQYTSDKNALRIISGRHKIQLKRGGKIVFDKDVTLGESETRIIKVTENE